MGSFVPFRPDYVIGDADSPDNVVYSLRTRTAIADVNTGATLLPAIPGYAYRLVNAVMIAVGGAVAAATTIDILGTQTTAKKLLAVAVAGLGQSVLATPTGANSTVLADGASYLVNDANTAITIGKTGSTATTATHVDTILSYTIQKA